MIFLLELARKCTDRGKLDSRTLNSQEHQQCSKRDVKEKEEENVIESSMSSELSELSVRSEDDTGEQLFVYGRVIKIKSMAPREAVEPVKHVLSTR